MNKIMVVGDNETKRREVAAWLHEADIKQVKEVRSGPAALEVIEHDQPDVLFLFYEVHGGDALHIAECVSIHQPKRMVMLIAETVDIVLLQRAMESGILHVLNWPMTSQNLLETLTRAVERQAQRQLGAQSKSNGALSKVITVFGAKGGIGKTTVAVNLAVKLAQNGKKVAILDLDLQFGDVGVFMDLKARDTIAELAQERAQIDMQVIRNYMLVHVSGAHVLCAPKSPELAEFISSSNVEKWIQALRQHYDYVVIDTAQQLSDIALTALEQASLILAIMGLDISSIRNTRVSLGIMESLGMSEKVRVLCNREVEGAISVKDAEKVLERRIVYTIPSDWRLAVASQNKGEPVVLSARKSRLAQAFSDIAQQLLKEASL